MIEFRWIQINFCQSIVLLYSVESECQFIVAKVLYCSDSGIVYNFLKVLLLNNLPCQIIKKGFHRNLYLGKVEF